MKQETWSAADYKHFVSTGKMPPARPASRPKDAQKPKRRIPREPSKLETELAQQIVLAGLPEPRREAMFHPERKWRFDFSWTPQMVACEVQGAVYAQGRHSRGTGYTEDCVKACEAGLLGWLYLPVTGEHIASGQAIGWIRRALEAREAA